MKTDVVIVGGGVAGSALAARLAAADVGVVVLERETSYRDMVRGEAIVPWGFLEAAALGVDGAIMDADGVSVITRMVPYDAALTVSGAQELATDLSDAVPGAPGVIGIGHPELREALASAAVKDGATLYRGVRRSTVRAGDSPVVTCELDGRTEEISCRLIIAADGKFSTTRAALGVEMASTQARVKLTGMLVDDAGVWDRCETTIAVDGRNQFIVIPRADNRLRLYVGRHVDDPEPLTGRQAITAFLEAYRTPIFPDSDRLAESTPIGPCATFPMCDSWTSTPVMRGAALVGDAAGWSNPVTAQGLSIGLRDARVLSEVLLDNQRWGPEVLAAYAVERTERMRRLRFSTALADLVSGFGMSDRDTRRARVLKVLARRPELGKALTAIHAGPWSIGEEAFGPDILTTLALA